MGQIGVGGVPTRDEGVEQKDEGLGQRGAILSNCKIGDVMGAEGEEN